MGASFLNRLLVGLCFYGIGLFWAVIAFPSSILIAIVRAKFDIKKVFLKKNHNKLPKVALDGFDHAYIQTKSGMKFHYVHAGDENNPLMLCLHGFPECWYSWKHVLKQFSSKYHVVAFDMRGYGESDKPESISKYHITYLVNDVQEIVAALGYQKAVIVGHDWGAIVSWAVPLFFPDIVSKLIIMNAPNQKGLQDFTKSYPLQFLKSWYFFFFQLPWLPEIVVSLDDYQNVTDSLQGRGGAMALKNCLAYYTDDEVEVVKCTAFNNIQYPINYYRAMNPLYRGLGIKPITKQIVQPTLLIWGKEDAVLDYRMVPYCEKYVSDIKTVMIEGASHWVGLDAPDKVRDAMDEFLKED